MANISGKFQRSGLTVIGDEVTEWQSFTPSFTNLTTNSVPNAVKRRVGDTMEIKLRVDVNSVSGTIFFNIPDGLTIGETTSLSVLGSAIAWDIGSVRYLGSVYQNNSTSVAFVSNADSVLWGTSEPHVWASGDDLTIEMAIPIAEWSVSPSYANGRVEYAYNSSTSTLADTTSFGYGEDGAEIQAFAPAATGSVDKRVRFKTPIQNSDKIELQFRSAVSGMWVNASDALCVAHGLYDGTSQRYVGAQVAQFITSDTDVDVSFYSGAFWRASASAIRSWSAFKASYDRWRVVKSSNPLGIGTGLHTSSETGAISPDTQVIYGDKSFNTNTLHIDSTNSRVGIGTTSPANILDVRPNASDADTSFEVTSSGGEAVLILRNTSGTITHRFDADGTTNFIDSYLGIGTNTGIDAPLHVQTADTSGSFDLSRFEGPASSSNGFDFVTFVRGTSEIGSIRQNSTTSVAYNTSSDVRLKEDLKDFDGLEIVKKLNPVDFKWKTDTVRDIGFIAQDVEKVHARLVSVSDDENKTYSMDYGKLTPILTKAIKQQQEIIEELRARLDLLENK